MYVPRINHFLFDRKNYTQIILSSVVSPVIVEQMFVSNGQLVAALISPELGDALAKVALFALVQALVYLILRKSSDVFSTARTARSLSFRPMRSMSVRRVLAVFSDVPVGVPEDGGSSTSPAHPGVADRED